MGILDNVRHKAAELGERVKGGLGSVKERAADLVDDTRDREREDDTDDTFSDAPDGLREAPSETADDFGDITPVTDGESGETATDSFGDVDVPEDPFDPNAPADADILDEVQAQAEEWPSDGR